MESLKNLIKQYPELGDVLADIHTQLFYLHNSNSSPEQAPQASVGSIYQLDSESKKRLSQFEARLLHMENAVMKARAKKKGKYQEYSTDESVNSVNP